MNIDYLQSLSNAYIQKKSAVLKRQYWHLRKQGAVLLVFNTEYNFSREEWISKEQFQNHKSGLPENIDDEVLEYINASFLGSNRDNLITVVAPCTSTGAIDQYSSYPITGWAFGNQTDDGTDMLVTKFYVKHVIENMPQVQMFSQQESIERAALESLVDNFTQNNLAKIKQIYYQQTEVFIAAITASTFQGIPNLILKVEDVKYAGIMKLADAKSFINQFAPSSVDYVLNFCQNLLSTHRGIIVIASYPVSKIINITPYSFIVESHLRASSVTSSTGNSECFVATATFGTPYEVEVIRYRNFRDKYLSQSILGKVFIKVYYRWLGPSLAKAISSNQHIKKVSAAILGQLVNLLPYDC